MKHRFHVEFLYHFSCGHCGKWWSIGDWRRSGEFLACPQCGTLAEVEQVRDVVLEESV